MQAWMTLVCGVCTDQVSFSAWGAYAPALTVLLLAAHIRTLLPRTILEPLVLCHPDAPKTNSWNLMLSLGNQYPVTEEQEYGSSLASRHHKLASAIYKPGLPIGLGWGQDFPWNCTLAWLFMPSYIASLLPCRFPLEDTSLINHLYTHAFLRICFLGIQDLSCL